MAGELHNSPSATLQDDFIAELTAAAYPIALRHKGGEGWLDLELELWHVMAQTVKKWQQRAPAQLYTGGR